VRLVVGEIELMGRRVRSGESNRRNGEDEVIGREVVREVGLVAVEPDLPKGSETRWVILRSEQGSRICVYICFHSIFYMSNLPHGHG